MRNFIFLIIIGFVVFFVIRMFDTAPTSSSTLTNGIYKSTDTFKDAFNETASKFGSQLTIKELKVKDEGSQQTFEYSLDNESMLIGQVNSIDNSLSSITLIDLGANTTHSNFIITQLISILLMTTNPELTPDDRLKIFKELGVDINQAANPYDLEGDAMHNNLKYSVTSDESIGIVFSIHPNTENQPSVESDAEAAAAPATLCPPASFIETANHDSPNHSLNYDSDPVESEMSQKVTTANYSVFIPKNWEVINDSFGVIFNINHQEIGRMDIRDTPNEEITPLYLLSHADLLQCKELVDFPTAGVEYSMHMTSPAGDMPQQEAYDLIQFNLVFKSATKNRVVVIYLDRRKVSENTASGLAKTVVLKADKAR